MICEKCKECWNYKVSEIGCYGSDKPCEHYTGEDLENEIKGSLASSETDKENID